MNILAINCGSSTLKFALFQLERTPAGASDERIAIGAVERIGEKATLEFRSPRGAPINEASPILDHAAAAARVLDWLGTLGGVPDAVGHRVVHGVWRFRELALLDEDAITGIEAVSELAPLHNAPALSAIRAARSAQGPSVPMTAVFDTDFHRTMPERASRYAIEPELAAKHAVYRYGFHGLAHRSMMEGAAALRGKPPDELRLVTLQLGNGCSATAIDRGRSIDTSMGFTPLEGLVMGTRSGDIDPSVVSYLARREGVSAEDVTHRLNERSGLLGMSARSGNMRTLLEAAGEGDEAAAFAIDLFCYRVRKDVGAYLVVLGGADAVVFGGGIGERSAEIRRRICEPLAPFGLKLDEALNQALNGEDGRISTVSGVIAAYVVHTNEERLIALLLRYSASNESRTAARPEKVDHRTSAPLVPLAGCYTRALAGERCEVRVAQPTRRPPSVAKFYLRCTRSRSRASSG